MAPDPVPASAYNIVMKTLAKALAILLSYLIGVTPVMANMQAAVVQAGGVQSVPVAAVGAHLGSFQGLQAGALQSSVNGGISSSILPSIRTSLPAISGRGVSVQAQAAAPAGAATLSRVSAVSQPSVSRSVSIAVQDGGAPAVAGPKAVEKKLEQTTQAAAEAVKGLQDLQGGDAKLAADKQFSVLTGEEVSGRSGAGSDAVVAAQGGTLKSSLAKAGETAQVEKKAEVPPAKPGLTQVFKDPERNRSFWRYVWGNITFMIGFQMYMVGLPYLISSLTKNSLGEHNDARLQNAEALKALIRENRSIARMAHWGAQAISYFTIPLFVKKGEAGSAKKWLGRSLFARAVVLAGVPALFFSTGLVSLPTAIGILVGIFALQSFFQGITVTTESAVVSRIFGDASVTSAERTKANSILSFIGSVIAIIAPAIAGHIASIKDIFGKSGAGGAVIYGIYAAAASGAALFYAMIRIKADKAKSAGQGGQADTAKKGIKETLKDLARSAKQGVKMVWGNRFLRTMLIISLVSSLFSDPLIFNVLPEYVETLVVGNNATMAAIMNLPVLGWLVKGLTSTPMGYFSFLTVVASVGAIVGAALIKPMRKLFGKFGFKNEEALMIPFYTLAALEVPLFWVMLYYPSLWGVLALYGLQSLVTSFGFLTVSGLNQKTLAGLDPKDVSKVLAAQSLLGMVAAIASTFAYGFLLTNIPIATSMLIAAIATTVMGALRIAAPWFATTKEQRQGSQ